MRELRRLARLLTGRTGLLVAHRLETLDRVDTVLVIDDGRVVEFGPRELLAADTTSHFARLLRASMADGVLVS